MRLAGVTDQAGNQTSVVSDALGRPTEIDQPFDPTNSRVTKTQLAYDEDGNQAQTTDPRGKTTTESYDALDRLATKTAPGAASCPGCSPTQEVTSYAYVLDPTDGSGNPVRVANPSDSQSVTATEEVNTTRGSSAGSGEVTTDDYDASGNQISQSHPQFHSTIDPVGLQTTYTYDGVGNQLTVTRPLGNAANGTRSDYTTTRAYDGSNHVTSSTVMDGGNARTTTYSYDGDGNVKQMQAPGAQSSPSDSTLSQITSYTYNGRDMPWTTSTGTTSKTARVTVTEFDPNGNLIRAVNAAGVNPDTASPYYSYGGDYTAGQATSTDPNPNANIDATIRVYNDNDTLRTVYLPWGCSVPANDASSRQCNSSDIQDHRRWREEFNPTTDGLDRTASIGETYDWTANTTATNKTNYTYFANGWIQQRQNPATNITNTYDHDAAGDETSWTTKGSNENIRNVSRQYWDDGKVCARAKTNSPPSCDATDPSIDNYYYTATERLSEYTGQCTDGQSALHAKLKYDLADRVTAVYGASQTANTGCGSGDGALKDTTYTYDLDGNAQTRYTDGAYDARSGTAPGGELATFHYDTLDRETQMDVSANGTTSQPTRHYKTSYWLSGKVNTRSRWQDGQDSNTVTENNYYNDDGTLSQQTRSSDGKDQTYSYDADGNRTQSENGTHLYNALDQEIRWTRGGTQDQANSGSTVSYTLTGTGAMTQTVDTAPIVTNQSSLPGSTTTSYTLSGEQIASASTEVKTNSGSIDCTTNSTYQYGTSGSPDGLSSITPAAGTGTGCPTTTTPAMTYSYDGFDHMTNAKGPDAKSTQTPPTTVSDTYTYDPLDRRARKTEDRGGGQTTNFSYIGLTNDLSREKGPDSSGNQVTRTYDYSSNGNRLGVVRTDSTHPDGILTTFAKDANGSVEGLEDPTKTSGSQIDDSNRYHYTPYGDLEKGRAQGANDPSRGTETPEQALGTDAQTNNLRFEGFYYDSGIKTYDELSRNYRPDTPQFTTEDHFEQAVGDQALAADPLTQDRYAYAGGNPTSDIEYDGYYADRGPGCRYGNGESQYTDPSGTVHRSFWGGNGTPASTVTAHPNGTTVTNYANGSTSVSTPTVTPQVRVQRLFASLASTPMVMFFNTAPTGHAEARALATQIARASCAPYGEGCTPGYKQQNENAAFAALMSGYNVLGLHLHGNVDINQTDAPEGDFLIGFFSGSVASIGVKTIVRGIAAVLAGGAEGGAAATAEASIDSEMLRDLKPVAGGAPGAMFGEAGIEMDAHFVESLAGRAGSRLSEADALDAYGNGRLFFDPKFGTYIRYSSRTQVAVATDAPSGGTALTVFEGAPSPRWNPILWRPGQ
jgi:RHS repeat-associated protein